MLPLAVIAAILETAVSTVKCCSVSLKKENYEACYDSITLYFILNESVKAVRHTTSSRLMIAKKSHENSIYLSSEVLYWSSDICESISSSSSVVKLPVQESISLSKQ